MITRWIDFATTRTARADADSEAALLAAGEEVKSRAAEIGNAAISWCLSNAGKAVDYIVNPNDAKRSDLAAEMVKGMIAAGGLASFPSLARYMSIEAENAPADTAFKMAYDKVPAFKGVVSKLEEWIGNTLVLGRIPDDISSKSAALVRLDLPDVLGNQIPSELEALRNRHSGNKDEMEKALALIRRDGGSPELSNTIRSLMASQGDDMKIVKNAQGSLTHCFDILGGAKDRCKETVDVRSLSEGVTALLQHHDGNIYEVTVKPAEYSTFRGMWKEVLAPRLKAGKPQMIEDGA